MCVLARLGHPVNRQVMTGSLLTSGKTLFVFAICALESCQRCFGSVDQNRLGNLKIRETGS